jgi:hypothetical protein
MRFTPQTKESIALRDKLLREIVERKDYKVSRRDADDMLARFPRDWDIFS